MTAELPWRGPGEGRPDLPLPPDKMPNRRGGRMLKRWRYVGVFTEEFLLCAARVQIGPVGQTFWVVWDREERTMHENTRARLPGARGEVWREGREGRPAPGLGKKRGADLVDHVRWPRTCGCGCASATASGSSRSARPPTANTCWTRKRAGVPVECDVRVGDKRWQAGGAAGSRTSRPAITHATRSGAGPRASESRTTAARSAGTWSAGSTTRPSARSARSGSTASPSEPAPVEFEGLEAIAFGDGAGLEFEAESRAPP